MKKNYWKLKTNNPKIAKLQDKMFVRKENDELKKG